MTTVIYRADKFGRVKMEQYTQTRLADGQITLDYSEHYETHPERVTHRNVLDADLEVSAAETQPPRVIVTSGVEDETDGQLEDSDGQMDGDENEVLTEEEKKGLYLFAQLYAQIKLVCFIFVFSCLFMLQLLCEYVFVWQQNVFCVQ